MGLLLHSRSTRVRSLRSSDGQSGSTRSVPSKVETTFTVTVEKEQHEDDYHNRRSVTQRLLITEGQRGDVTVRVVGDTARELAKKLVGGVPTPPQEGGR